MLADGRCVLTEPRQERRCQLHAPVRMVAHHLPLVVVEATRLVDDLRWDLELADVVEHGCPLQLVAPLGIDLHLLAEHVGVSAHPVAMTSRSGIVGIEGSRQRENCLSRVGEIVLTAGSLSPLNELFERMGVAGLHR